jgi:hypothetical protein
MIFSSSRNKTGFFVLFGDTPFAARRNHLYFTLLEDE